MGTAKAIVSDDAAEMKRDSYSVRRGACRVKTIRNAEINDTPLPTVLVHRLDEFIENGLRTGLAGADRRCRAMFEWFCMSSRATARNASCTEEICVSVSVK